MFKWVKMKKNMIKLKEVYLLTQFQIIKKMMKNYLIKFLKKVI